MNIFYYIYMTFNDFFEVIYPQLKDDFFDEEKITE